MFSYRCSIFVLCVRVETRLRGEKNSCLMDHKRQALVVQLCGHSSTVYARAKETCTALGSIDTSWGIPTATERRGSALSHQCVLNVLARHCLTRRAWTRVHDAAFGISVLLE